MDMYSRLFAREEIEAEAICPEYSWTHVENDTPHPLLAEITLHLALGNRGLYSLLITIHQLESHLVRLPTNSIHHFFGRINDSILIVIVLEIHHA
jgi:hypothetical protein